MRAKKGSGFLMVVLLAVFLLAGSSWAAEPIVIKFAHAGAASMEDPMHGAATWFATEMEKRTGGRIKVNVFGGMVLGGEKETFDGIKMGAIQMGDISNAAMGTYVPMALLWDLPFIIDSTEHAHKVFDSWIGDKVREKFLPLGARIFHFDDGGFRQFTNNSRPIRTPADMKGLKVRVYQSPVLIATFQAIPGVGAVPMSFAEVYSALQQKVVDAQDNPLTLVWTQKFYEVQKYLSLTNHVFYPRMYCINEKFFQSLPADLKAITEKTANDAAWEQRRLNTALDNKLLDRFRKETKIQVNTDVDREAFRKLMVPVWEQFYDKIGGTKEEGKKLVDAVRNIK
jgi:TRAP-type transport system periplasmic protein